MTRKNSNDVLQVFKKAINRLKESQDCMQVRKDVEVFAQDLLCGMSSVVTRHDDLDVAEIMNRECDSTSSFRGIQET